MSDLRSLINLVEGKKFNDYIVEGPKQDYQQMFQNMPDPVKEKAAEHFKWAANTFKKEGEQGNRNSAQIMWYMRFVRLALMKDFLHSMPPNEKNDLADKARSFIDKESKKMAQKGHEQPINYVNSSGTVLSPRFKRDIEHFRSLDIEEINDAEFGMNTPDELLNQFGRIERQWQEKQKRFVQPEGDEKVMIEFPEDNLAWFDLGRGSCSLEGKAMGHCGNVPSERHGDRVISLREIVKKGGKTLHKPHLTFILDSDGRLGEMKGFANQKPGEKFHKHIVALLKHPDVDAIKGGGYEAHRNFSIHDLDPETKEELLRDNPNLKTIHDIIAEEGITREVIGRIEDELDKHYIRYNDFTPVNEGSTDRNQPIIVDYWRSVEEFAREMYDEPLMSVLDALDNLEDYLQDKITDDPSSQSEDFYIEIIEGLRPRYLQKIYDITGVSDPRKAWWRLQEMGDNLYRDIQNAVDESVQLDEKKKAEVHEELQDRVHRYLDTGVYSPMDNYEISYNKDNLDDPVRLVVDLDSILDVLEAMDQGDDAMEHLAGNGIEVYDLMTEGFSYHNADYSSERRGEYGPEEDRLVDDNNHDLYLGGLTQVDEIINIDKARDLIEQEMDRLYESELKGQPLSESEKIRRLIKLTL